jgi:hypothetical protein
VSASSGRATFGCGRRPGGLVLRDAGPLQRPLESVALADRRDEVEARALGSGGERFDRLGRRHPLSGPPAERERSEGEGAGLVALRIGDRRGGRPDHRIGFGGERPGAVAERRAGREAAKPVARPDPDAEVHDEVDVGHEAALGLVPAAEAAGDGRTVKNGLPRDDRGAAGVADVPELIQGGRAPARLKRCPLVPPSRRSGL